MQQFGGRAVDYAVDCAHQRGPALVVEDDDDRRARKVHRVVPVLTPAADVTSRFYDGDVFVT